MAHVKSGYHRLDDLFNDLRALRAKNNQEVFTLENKIRVEVYDCLTALPDLSPDDCPSSGKNPYHLDQILRAVQDGGQLTVDTASSITVTPDRDFRKAMDSLKKIEGVYLLTSEFGEIARGQQYTLTRLKSDIERIRILHKTDFELLEANAAKFGIITENIHDEVSKIISEIEDLEHLEGTCKWEKSH